MTDPRFDDRRPPQMDDLRDDNGWAWLPGAIFAIAVVAGVALWAYSSGDLERSVQRSPDATTGQSTRAPAPNPAPTAPQR
jgi:hypothetical protein